MIKRFFSFTAVVIAVSLILYFSHKYLLASLSEESGIPITAMYIFHFVAYLLISLGVELLYSRLPSQVGYAYLASVFIKIGLFVLIFQSSIFGEELSLASRLSIIVPMFIFLIFEATYAGRLMNSQ